MLETHRPTYFVFYLVTLHFLWRLALGGVRKLDWLIFYEPEAVKV